MRVGRRPAHRTVHLGQGSGRCGQWPHGSGGGGDSYPRGPGKGRARTGQGPGKDRLRGDLDPCRNGVKARSPLLSLGGGEVLLFPPAAAAVSLLFPTLSFVGRCPRLWWKEGTPSPSFGWGGGGVGEISISDTTSRHSTCWGASQSVGGRNRLTPGANFRAQ